MAAALAAGRLRVHQSEQIDNYRVKFRITPEMACRLGSSARGSRGRGALVGNYRDIPALVHQVLFQLVRSVSGFSAFQ
jgi:hypothetical protein